MAGRVLHQQWPPCHELKAGYYHPCSVSSPEELQQTLSTSVFTSKNSKPSCFNSTFSNMTCARLVRHEKQYICMPSSGAGPLDPQINWEDEWTVMESPDVGLKRSICHSQSSWCLDWDIRLDLGYLVWEKVKDLSRTILSSQYNINYDAAKIRLNVWNSGALCGWRANDSDTSPWVLFDMKSPYTGVGVLIRKKCSDFTQYVRTLHVLASDDNATFSYAAENLEPVYQGMSSTTWFVSPVTARYWKIEVLTWNNAAIMKVDIIGYV